MLVVSKIEELKNIIKDWKQGGYSIGLVPTMGFLHQGHRSLIEKARGGNDKVVVSIFVNPIQFGPDEDFDKYPRDFDKDKEVCVLAGADLIFAPQAEEMYPESNIAYVDIKDDLGNVLCGKRRPGHFRGVCTVCSKLFNLCQPDRAYFGEKDAQQLLIIKRMVKDLNFDLGIVSCPIIRESDGLAMSSRNSYLSPEERKAALIISKSLNLAKEELATGERDAAKIKQLIIGIIETEPKAKIDYAEIVEAETLKDVDKITMPILTAVAVYIGKTRLIDNFFYKEI